jgi:hypothetical protein
MFEIWPNKTISLLGTTRFFSRKEVWEEVVFSKKIGEVEATVHNGWRLSHSSDISNEVISEGLDSFIKATKDYLAKEEEN